MPWLSGPLKGYVDGLGLEEIQKLTLGQAAYAPENGALIYGQFHGNGTYNTGAIVRHAEGGDFPGTETSGGDAGRIVVSEAAAAGTNIVKTANKFTDKTIVGAYGLVVAGAGAGQLFVITNIQDANTAEIQVLSSNTARNVNNTGWVTALGTDSRLRLWLPGRFTLAPAASNTVEIDAGAVQQNAFTVTDTYKPYGWIRAKGNGFTIANATGIATGNPLYVAGTGGKVAPATTVANLSKSVGRALGGGVAVNDLVLTALDIPIIDASRNFAPPGHEPDIRGAQS